MGHVKFTHNFKYKTRRDHQEDPAVAGGLLRDAKFDALTAVTTKSTVFWVSNDVQWWEVNKL
jgi:hypothetical protein